MSKKKFYGQCAVCFEVFCHKWSVKRHFQKNKHFYGTEIPKEIKSLLPSDVLYNVTKYTKKTPLMMQICLPTISSLKDFEEWMKKFSTIHKCKFIRHYVKKKSTISTFQVLYFCEYRGNGKMSNNTKITKCRSTIYAVGRSTANYISVRLNLCHNHALLPQKLKPSAEMKNIFLQMFLNGCSVKESFQNYRIHLRKQTNSDSEFLEYISNKQKFPDYHWVWSLHRQVVEKSNLQNISEIGALKEFINQINSEYNECICKMKEYDSKNFSIAILTPIMKSILETEAAGEIVLVESIGSLEKFNCKVILLMCRTNEGSAPIGVIVTTNDTPYVRCFQLYLDFVSPKAFNGRGENGPSVIITNDSSPENSPLKTVFSRSSHVLSTFHVLLSMYRWLLKPEHEFSEEERNTIYFNLNRIVSSKNESEATYYFEFIKEIFPQNSHLIKYLDNWIRKKKKWMFCYKKRYNWENTNFLEKSARVLKELIFYNMKTQSLPQLVNYLITDFSKNYKESDFDQFIQSVNHFLKRESITEAQLNNYYFEQSLECPAIYKMLNRNKKTFYEINSDVGVCSCFMGVNGFLCKHQEILSLYVPQFKHPLQFNKETILLPESPEFFHSWDIDERVENSPLEKLEQIVIDDGVTCYEEVLMTEEYVEELESLQKKPKEVMSEFKITVDKMMSIIENNIEYYESGIEAYVEVLKKALRTPEDLKTFLFSHENFERLAELAIESKEIDSNIVSDYI